MYYLTDHEILLMTSNEEFEDGYKLYEQNIFPPKAISVKQKDEKTRMFESVYRSPLKTYHIFLEINCDLGLVNNYCDCGSSSVKKLCHHQVGLALSILNFYQKKDINLITKERLEMLEIKRMEQRKISEYDNARKAEMIRNKNRFKKLMIEYNHISPKLYVNNLIKIEPKIIIKDEFFLTLKIGIDKMYVIDDINNFVFNIINEEYFEYGKKLSFYHSINSFDEKSKKLIDILVKINELNKNIKERKQLLINNSFKEDILNVYKNDRIKIEYKKQEFIADVKEEIYPLKLSINNNMLTSNIQEGLLILGYKENFFLYEKTIYLLKKIKKEEMLIHQMIANYGDINLEDIMDDFLINLYPKIYKFVDIDDDFKKEHPLHELKIDSYFNEENGVIKLNSKFYIEDEEVAKEQLINKMYNHINYDEYYKIIELLGFKEINKEIKIVDDNKYLMFLKTNLDDLKRYGNIYISDSLRALQIRQIPKIKINASYGIDMLSICFSDLSFSNDELYRILNAYQKKKRYIKLDNNVIDLEDENVTELASFVNQLELDSERLNEEQKKPLYQAFNLSNNNHINLDNQIKKMLIDIKNYKKANYELPECLASTLREYQIEAYKWLKTLTNYHLGGILADDMGLGKTLEILSLVLSDEVNAPTLIVSPMSLVYNWRSEIQKWAKEIPYRIILGNTTERESLINNILLEKKEICITSYDSLKRDIELYEKIKFRFVILDEGQYIKNFFTQKARAVKKINGEIKFSLTGTPIENSLLDLWSIFDFVMPGYLLSFKQFKNDYEKGIMKDEAQLNLLVKRITPFILRRTKKAVLTDLPDKFETITYAKMDKEQRMLYEGYLLKAKELISNTDSKIEILAILTRLRQICVDPSMFIDNYKGGNCKMDVGMEIILESVQNGHKLLVFSQFKSMFSTIIDKLKENNINYLIITGETKSEDRIKSVEEFNKNEEIKVFLISLKAGGTGLNLTGADIVIHFDPWWNISAENQATDRAHRIGQKKPVQVIKIIVEDTIEQKVLELQNIKFAISKMVIADGDANISKLEIDDVKFILQ